MTSTPRSLFALFITCILQACASTPSAMINNTITINKADKTVSVEQLNTHSCLPTMDCFLGDKSRTINSIYRSFEDQAGFGTYVYLIVTSKTKNKEQSRAAFDALMCEIESVNNVRIPPKQTALLVAQVKDNDKHIANSADLKKQYNYSIASNLHGMLTQLSNNYVISGFNQDSNIYLLGSQTQLGLSSDNPTTIHRQLSSQIDTIGAVEIVPLDNFTTIEIVNLINKMKKMYHASVVEEKSYLSLTLLREPQMLTFLRQILRYIPTPIPKAVAQDEICSI